MPGEPPVSNVPGDGLPISVDGDGLTCKQEDKFISTRLQYRAGDRQTDRQTETSQRERDKKFRGSESEIEREMRKEMFYLMMHSTHFIR